MMQRYVLTVLCVASLHPILAADRLDKPSVDTVDSLIAEGRYERARNVLMKLLPRDEEPWRIRERLAEIEVACGDVKTGFRAFAAALNDYPTQKSPEEITPVGETALRVLR